MGTLIFAVLVAIVVIALVVAAVRFVITWSS